MAKTELDVVVDILEEAIDKVIENYDNRVSGNEKLLDFTKDNLESIIEIIEYDPEFNPKKV